MKKFVFHLSALCLLLFSACTSPADYNTAVMDEVVKVEKDALKITQRLQEKDFDGAQVAFQEGKDQTKASLKKLERMSSFRGDDDLRQAAIGFVSFYDGLFRNEYQQAFDILQKGGRYSMEDGDRLYGMLNDISIKGVEAKQKLIDELFAFIKKYNLIVERK